MHKKITDFFLHRFGFPRAVCIPTMRLLQGQKNPFYPGNSLLRVIKAAEMYGN